MTISIFQEPLRSIEVRNYLSKFSPVVVQSVINAIDARVGYRIMEKGEPIEYHPLVNQELLPYRLTSDSTTEWDHVHPHWKEIVLHAANVIAAEPIALPLEGPEVVALLNTSIIG